MSRVIITVDNALSIPISALEDEICEEIKTAFTFDNPEIQMARILNFPGWWKIPKTIQTWNTSGFEPKQKLIVPRGGLRSIRDIFEEHHIEYGFKDNRVEGSPVENYPEYIGHELRYYQEEAIQAALKKENCIIRMPTGGGKSLMAIALAARIKLNTIVILPTVGLFNQWCKDARESLKMHPDDLGIIHQKKRKLRPLTAAVQGTLASQGVDEELKEFFGVVILDETQKAAAKTVGQVVGCFPARYRIGISADERRKDRKEFITKGLFGSVAYEKKRKELEEEGFIVDVEIRVVPTNFEADWYGLADEDDANDDREVDFKRLIDEMMTDEERNKLALRFAFEEAENDEQVIMLAHRREHCIELEREFVKKGIRSGYFIGGNDYSREFEATREGILNGTVRVGVGTYGALGVGVNLPAVGAGVAITPIAGNKFAFNQVRGRLNRKGKGKTKARLYVLWDRYVYPSHLKNMAAWNPTVKVYDKGRWVDAKNYIKTMPKTQRGKR